MDQTAQVDAATTQPGVDPGERRRLAILAVLCVPGLVASSALALDNMTRPIFGSALTTWGFFGSLVGLAGLLSGFASILTWPGVVVLSLKSVKSAGLGLASRVAVVLGCMVATYSAVFFVVWFIIIPLGAGRAR